MRAKAVFLLFLMMMAGWILLSGNLAGDSLAVGAAAGLVIALIMAPGAAMLAEVRLTPRAVAAHVLFFLVFLRELVLSNLDVARRVVSPSLPINPGIVRVKTRLRTALGRFVLANAITLTPGTFTVEIRGDEMFIHWLDVTARDPEAATRQIVSRFEKYLEVAYG